MDRPPVPFRILLWTIGSVLIVVVAYLPSVGGGFFTDDHVYITQNRTLQEAPFSEIWRPWPVRTNPFEWLPLRDLSYRLDMELFGFLPAAYHVHNLVLYALCCAACWWCCLSIAAHLGRGDGPPSETGSPAVRAAAVATAIFAAHPAHVESVAWISGRKDLLSGLLALLSLAVFTSSLRRPGGRVLPTLLSAALFALALLSKATVLPLAVLVLILAAVPRDRRRIDPRALAAAMALGVVAGIVGAVHVAVGRGAGLVEGSGSEGPWLLILGTLARIAVLPVRLRLIYDLDPPGIVRVVTYGLGLATVALTGLGGWLTIRRRSLAGFGMLTFGVFCMPFLQWIPFRTWSVVSERFLFMPVLGVAIAAGALSLRVSARAAVVTITTVVLACTGVVFARSLEWASPDELMAGNVRYSPGHVLVVEAHVRRLVAGGSFEEARDAVRGVRDERGRRVLSLYVDAAEAARDGNLAEVRTLAPRVAEEISWDSDVLRTEAGNLALEAGAFAEAADIYRRVLEDAPYKLAVHYNLGLALAKAGAHDEAIPSFEKAIRSGIRAGEAGNHLGLLYWNLGRASEAETAFLAALDADPEQWHAAYNLARLYATDGRFDEARRLLSVARRRAVAAGADPAPVDELEAQIEQKEAGAEKVDR